MPLIFQYLCNNGHPCLHNSMRKSLVFHCFDMFSHLFGTLDHFETLTKVIGLLSPPFKYMCYINKPIFHIFLILIHTPLLNRCIKRNTSAWYLLCRLRCNPSQSKYFTDHVSFMLNMYLCVGSFKIGCSILLELDSYSA